MSTNIEYNNFAETIYYSRTKRKQKSLNIKKNYTFYPSIYTYIYNKMNICSRIFQELLQVFSRLVWNRFICMQNETFNTILFSFHRTGKRIHSFCFLFFGIRYKCSNIFFIFLLSHLTKFYNNKFKQIN